MLKKEHKPKAFGTFQKGLKVFLFFEIAAFLGSYALWIRTNRDQEFRRYLNTDYPKVLEGYYQVCEFFDKERVERLREVDLAVFESKAK